MGPRRGLARTLKNEKPIEENYVVERDGDIDDCK